MKSRKSIKWFALVALGVASVATIAACAGDGSGEVYDGERIEIINPFSLDGSTGAWLSLVIPFLQEHTPGEPTIEQVSRSGGGGTTGPNFFERNTRSDGRSLLTSSGSSVFPYIYNQEGVVYDFADYTAILASALGGIVYVSQDTGITNVEQLCNADGLVWNAVSTIGLDSVPLLALDLLDDLDVAFNDSSADLNVTQDATSRGSARTLFINGEINISYDSLKTEIDQVVAENANLIFSVGIVTPDGELARDPTFPELPHFGEVYQQCNGREFGGIEKEAYLAVVVAGFGAQKVLWAKNDVPQEYIDALLEGATALVDDPDFEERKLVLVGLYDFFVGDDAQALFNATSNLSDEAYAWLRNRLNTTFSNANIPPRP